MDKVKKIIAETVIAGTLAGGAIIGGIEIHKMEVKNFRMGLIDRLEWTKNNQELCNKGKKSDKRCATIDDFEYYIVEGNKVKNIKTDKRGTLEEKIKNKMLK